MTATTAFVGDVHGHLPALRSLVARLEDAGAGRIVLLGDYINKGPDARLVIDFILNLRRDGDVIALRGNHEQALLECLATGDVRPLLRMSGAPTVRSYVEGKVGPDVAGELRRAVPAEHVAFLESLPREVRFDGAVASHEPSEAGDSYSISAHRPVGLCPEVGVRAARIDTGCGSSGGRLTGLLWPSLEVLQVDEVGRSVG